MATKVNKLEMLVDKATRLPARGKTIRLARTVGGIRSDAFNDSCLSIKFFDVKNAMLKEPKFGHYIGWLQMDGIKIEDSTQINRINEIVIEWEMNECTR